MKCQVRDLFSGSGEMETEETCLKYSRKELPSRQDLRRNG